MRPGEFMRLRRDQEVEIQKYWDLYRERPDYGDHNHGKKHIDLVVQNTQPLDAVLDVGFGGGQFMDQVAYHMRIPYGADVVPSSKPNTVIAPVWNLPFRDEHFPVVTSFDCLEHVLEVDVDASLFEIARVCYKVAILKIATAPSKSKGVNGEALHPTVKPIEWWAKKAEVYFNDVEIRGGLLVCRLRS
jgi:ubiquinone/menaquinone biosynthesis C-methylase UbiE